MKSIHSFFLPPQACRKHAIKVTPTVSERRHNSKQKNTKSETRQSANNNRIRNKQKITKQKTKNKTIRNQTKRNEAQSKVERASPRRVASAYCRAKKSKWSTVNPARSTLQDSRKQTLSNQRQDTVHNTRAIHKADAIQALPTLHRHPRGGTRASITGDHSK